MFWGDTKRTNYPDWAENSFSSSFLISSSCLAIVRYTAEEPETLDIANSERSIESANQQKVFAHMYRELTAVRTAARVQTLPAFLFLVNSTSPKVVACEVTNERQRSVDSEHPRKTVFAWA